MRNLVLCGLLLISVAGCNQTGARSPGGEMFMSDDAILARDDKQCRSFGAIPGTQAYLSCRLSLNQNRSRAGIAHDQSMDDMAEIGLRMMN